MNVDALLNHQFPVIEQKFSSKDVSAYSLSVGFGSDPMDLRQLQYVYGSSPQTPSSMALVLATPGFWQQEQWTGIDAGKCVLGDQSFQMHSPIPSHGTVSSQLKITNIIDKGPKFGAIITSQRTIRLVDTGTSLATLTMSTICRADGGFGGLKQEVPRFPNPPDWEADRVIEIPTMPQNALMFDLHGIVNPIHSWPPAAIEAGYPRPILHGICLLGFTHHALMRGLAKYDDSRIKFVRARFIKPFFPGETLKTEVWINGADVSYRVSSKERDVVSAVGSAVLLDESEESTSP